MVKKASVPSNRSMYLLHPCPTMLVSSYRPGKINMLAIAWITPVSVDPPLVAMSVRPTRFSHELIMETKEFVVNVPTFDLTRKVLYCGRYSGRDVDKFKETGLTAQKAEQVGAPLIQDCVGHIECRLKDAYDKGDHTLMVGEVLAASAVPSLFEKVFDIKEYEPCLHIGMNYFTRTIKHRIKPEV